MSNFKLLKLRPIPSSNSPSGLARVGYTQLCAVCQLTNQLGLRDDRCGTVELQIHVVHMAWWLSFMREIYELNFMHDGTDGSIINVPRSSSSLQCVGESSLQLMDDARSL